MTRIKNVSAVFLAVGLAAGMSACAPAGSNTDGDGEASSCNVGISMPTRSLERWINDGEGLKEKLEAQDCTVDLQYADDKTDQQISQIQNQVAGGAKILVVAAIDGETLGPALEDAKDQDVQVIAYDRLINGTDAVDYYATFDNYKVGQLQGEFIEEQLGLAEGKGPFNLEPFAGSPDDNNASFFFSGAWDVLLPYVESGQLVVPSGKSPASNDEWTSIGILGWQSADAQAEMDNRLQSFYTGGEKVDVVLSPNDSLALGIEASLNSAGYEPGSDWPLITGQDADVANVKAMLADQQSMTVWKDTRELGTQVESMIMALVDGEDVEVNDTETYNNEVKVVPTYILDPQVVTKDTVQSALVDSGFMEAGDVGL
ncbi:MULTISPECIES: multiple monosaccharide ABC transporter substrate-binding protein [unclassified Arthrobacter]|uniref:multiple monosaccharide ABC transporter substrate-binding protein n=1 Tax=unclassified Arthrobacter TaxID=235627 RepID=UPI00210621B4|nr:MULTISPECIES: multiple monosaccharide ABC transporter substrate-binding protein [unclassified Arthrobacter]MCQ1947544.1 sugar ABC transporter substrate-binding protein [Arthrobacter sp. zg-Y1116]MCQ1987496.1 sugar ABC transporter substrate-binding protein [Arthrobacter sp. zg-Y844]